MKEIMDQGVAASKDFAVKAGTKAQELGEMGILLVEIKQLEAQAQKQMSRLGNEVYAIFVENEQKTLSSTRDSVKILLDEIIKIKSSIEKKEADLKKLKNK
jgi:hypothetical protein